MVLINNKNIGTDKTFESISDMNIAKFGLSIISITFYIIYLK